MASNTGGVPSFSIQGRLYKERERLSFGGMTEQERRLRKQWIADQVLADHEPVEVPELVKANRNIFRRIIRKPLDLLVYDRLKHKINPSSALIARTIIGKCLTGIWCIYAGAYYFMYNQNDWSRKGGIRVITNRPSCLPGETFISKVQYDPSQEISYDVTKTISDNSTKTACEPSTNLSENEHQIEQLASNDKYQNETVENSQVKEVAENNTIDDKTDPPVYTICPTVEPPSLPPKGRDKGSNYRSLGSYYASRGFENSPI